MLVEKFSFCCYKMVTLIYNVTAVNVYSKQRCPEVIDVIDIQELIRMASWFLFDRPK